MHKLRNFCFLLLILLVGIKVHAQQFSHPIWEDEDAPKTLFGSQSEYLPYIAFETKYTSGLDMPWVFFGMQAGVTINKNMTVGLAAYGLISSLSYNFDATDLDIFGGYGGLMIGAKIRPDKIFHINLPVLIGVGNLELSDPNFFPFDDSAYTVERSNCLVIETGVELEVNITRKLRLAFGGGYRYISGFQLDTFTDTQLRGLSFQFLVKYGKY